MSTTGPRADHPHTDPGQPACNVAGCDHTRPEECEIVRCAECGEPYDGTESPVRHIARAHLDILARQRFGSRYGGIVRSDVTADNPGFLGRSCMYADDARVFVIAGNACCGGNGAEASCEVCRRG